MFRNYAAEVIPSNSALEQHSPTSARSDQSVSTPSIFACAPDLDDDHIEIQALNIFFKDFCIRSRDLSTSRGFLDGLESNILNRDSSAQAAVDVEECAKIIAMAALGRRLERPDLIQRTGERYGELLLSFRRTLARKDSIASTEILATAVLLGIYEV